MLAFATREYLANGRALSPQSRGCHTSVVNKPSPVVRRPQVDARAHRHHTTGVHRAVAEVVVPLCVVEVYGLRSAWHLVHVSQPAPQIRIVRDVANVALEVTVVDDVKAYCGREDADVCLRESGAHKEAALAQPRFQLVKNIEDVPDRLLVGGLRGGEAGAVDGVVEGGIGSLIQRVNLGR